MVKVRKECFASLVCSVSCQACSVLGMGFYSHAYTSCIAFQGQAQQRDLFPEVWFG